jgi:hypothetical protein
MNAAFLVLKQGLQFRNVVLGKYQTPVNNKVTVIIFDA